MNNMLNDFGLFIDNLRKSRNMSREDFINGIISIRQYQRYVNGESSLNNEKLFKLIDRLGMNFFNIHKLYLGRNNEQTSKLDKIYNEILRDNLRQASELLEKVSEDDFHDEYNKSFYKLCVFLLQKRAKTMPTSLVISKLKELIDYPNCLNNEIINFVEYVAFIEISSYSSEKYDDVRILNFLYDKIKSGNISTDSILLSYLPSTYAHVTRKLGVIEEYDKALVIARKGIDWCINSETHNSLAHLFFYESITLRNLDRHEESLYSAKRLFSLLFVENKEHKTKKFTELFEKNFNMKVSEL